METHELAIFDASTIFPSSRAALACLISLNAVSTALGVLKSSSIAEMKLFFDASSIFASEIMTLACAIRRPKESSLLTASDAAIRESRPISIALR